MKVCYYQLLFDFRQGVRENLMKTQEVRVRIKVKNHCSKPSKATIKILTIRVFTGLLNIKPFCLTITENP